MCVHFASPLAHQEIHRIHILRFPLETVANSKSLILLPVRLARQLPYPLATSPLLDLLHHRPADLKSPR